VPPLREQIHARLREWIFTGDLPAGARLSPGELARRFGVSTMPVREALGFLLEEGLVETSPRRWTRVVKPDRGLAGEIYPLLALLEEHAVAASPLPTKATVAKLRSSNDALAKAGRRGDVVACMEADTQLHETLTDRSGNATLTRILRDLRTRIRLYEGAYYRLDHLEESLADHGAIIDALVAGDAQKAGRLVTANWLRGYRRVTEAID
jgi:DNA-binding GntR family transcriptional regulator